jgi:hypothetical protein
MRYLAFFMCLILIFTSCRIKEEPVYDDEVIEAEYVSRVKEQVEIKDTFEKTIIELPDGLTYTDYFYRDDKLHFICGDKLISYNKYGEDMEIIELPKTVFDIAVADNGDFIIYDGVDIIKMSTDNEIVKTIDVDLTGDFLDIFTDKLNRIYYFTTHSLYMLSAEGNVIFNIDIDGVLNKVHQFDDGKILLNIDEKYIQLDVNGHRLGREIKLPKVPYEYEIVLGDGYEIYLKSADLNVYGYLEREVVPIKIMDLINSGVNIYDIADFKIVSSEFMFYDTYDNKIVLLNKLETNSNFTSKSRILLASYGYDKQLIDLVLDFNLLNKLYYVNIHDYSVYGFNDDIDLFIADENLNIDKYTVQGLFTDFNRLMQNDEQLSQRHILSNVRDSVTYNGQLYTLTSNFKIHAFAGKTDIVGETFAWTTPNFEDFLPELGGKIRLISNIKPMDMLDLLTTDGFYGFVPDNFLDNPAFKRVIELTLHVASEIDRKGMYTGDDTEFRNNTTLLYYFEFNQPDDYTILPEIFGTDEITIKSIPNSSRAIIEPVRSYAISRKSNTFVIDGAWELVKILMKEYQVDGYFSSIIADFDEQIEASYLSDAEKVDVSNVVKNERMVKVSANNSAILEMVRGYTTLYFESLMSINKAIENIALRAKRYFANTVLY